MTKPKKEPSESFSFRIPCALKTALDAAAQQAQRTTADFIRVALRDVIQKHGIKVKP